MTMSQGMTGTPDFTDLGRLVWGPVIIQYIGRRSGDEITISMLERSYSYNDMLPFSCMKTTLTITT